MKISPRRSVLYMPGTNDRALEKARSLAADALILDLEDSVAPEAKSQARDKVVQAIKSGGIRVNALDTPWGGDDLKAAASVTADAILVPKVSRPGDMVGAAKLLK